MKNIKCKVIMLPVSEEQLKKSKPTDFIGSIFCNKSGKLSIQTNEEDIVKTSQWIGMSDMQLAIIPYHIYFVSNRKTNTETIAYDFDQNIVGFAGYRNDLKVMRVEATTNPRFQSSFIGKIGLPFLKKYVERKGKIDSVLIDMEGICDYGTDKPSSYVDRPFQRKDGSVVIHSVKTTFTIEQVQMLMRESVNLFSENKKMFFKNGLWDEDIANSWCNRNIEEIIEKNR